MGATLLDLCRADTILGIDDDVQGIQEAYSAISEGLDTFHSLEKVDRYRALTYFVYRMRVLEPQSYHASEERNICIDKLVNKGIIKRNFLTQLFQ